MTPAEIHALGDEICDFMEEMYGTLQAGVVYNIFWSLGTGHYIWEPDKYFACYWRIQPEDVQNVQDRIKPLDITNGSVMYVAEAASKVGMNVIVKRLREQAVGMGGVFWHRPAKKDKVYNFPSQQGATHGF